MILVDTSVWVDHLRRGDAQVAVLLEGAGVLMDLPMAVVASTDETLRFIEVHSLHGKGIGYVDVHLLASVALSDGAKLWTRDKRLRAVADELGCAYAGAGAH